jgi:hypothetical protein
VGRGGRPPVGRGGPADPVGTGNEGKAVGRAKLGTGPRETLGTGRREKLGRAGGSSSSWGAAATRLMFG